MGMTAVNGQGSLDVNLGNCSFFKRSYLSSADSFGNLSVT